jgi:uncharacterized protein (TIGR02996 family)
MPQERHFLAAIEAQPDDRTSRLVYADWLDERGDSRGELIRIEEEMRGIPIHSDRYWQLKPRRNELRRSAGKLWLKQMSYGTPYEPVFRDVTDGWKERWRLIREFIERRFGIPMADVDGQKKKSDSRLADLSPSIREWVTLIRQLRKQRTFKDALEVAEWEDWTDFRNPAGANFLVSLREPAYEYFIAMTNARDPDPPVMFEDMEGDTDGPAARRVTTFAFLFVIYCLQARKPERNMGGFRTPVTSLEPQVRRRLKRICPIVSRMGGVHIFERDDMIAVLSPDIFDQWSTGVTCLQVELCRPIQRDAIPAFLWDEIGMEGVRTGIFEASDST